MAMIAYEKLNTYRTFVSYNATTVLLLHTLRVKMSVTHRISNYYAIILRRQPYEKIMYDAYA